MLNWSDYEFHDWDFMRVAPRLESPRASYKNLIDAAPRIHVLDLPGNPAAGKIGADGPFLKP